MRIRTPTLMESCGSVLHLFSGRKVTVVGFTKKKKKTKKVHAPGKRKSSGF